MPSTVEVACVVIGALFILISLLGGGFKFLGSEVLNSVGRNERIVAAVIGMLFVLVGLISTFYTRMSQSSLEQSPVVQLSTVTPTVAPIPTSTTLTNPSPTALPPTIEPTPVPPIVEPSSTSTAQPIPTIQESSPTPEAPTITLPIPTLTPSILEVGEATEQDGVALRLVDGDFVDDNLFTSWRLTNNTGAPLRVSFGAYNFTAKDNNGNDLEVLGFQVPTPNGYDYCDPVEGFVIPDGGSVENVPCRLNLPLRILYSSGSCATTEITITVRDLSRITRAEWKILTPRC